MRVNYRYEPPGSMNVVSEPGEVCDYCGSLSLILPEGQMIPMPKTPIDEEFGHSEGDIHAHRKCAEEALAHYKEIVKLIEEGLTQNPQR